ncbi:MAG: SGNH/GDSL hydrolase family protein [Actinomycetia bacterium]|nr:SGNH/GDSL hydrolase family protein [Actinomycetes bacterium]
MSISKHIREHLVLGIKRDAPQARYLTYSVIGDSIGLRNGGFGNSWKDIPTSTDPVAAYGPTANGEMGALSALTNQRFIQLSNYCVSGKNVTDLMPDGQVSSAISDKPDIIYVSAGANDIIDSIAGTEITLATIKTEFDTIIASITGAGIIALVGTILPQDNADWANNPREANMILEINSYLKEQMAVIPNLIVYDRFSSFLDPTATDLDAATNYLEDGTHPSPEGFYAAAADFSSLWGDVLLNNTTAFETGQGAFAKKYFSEYAAPTSGSGWTYVGTITQQTNANDGMGQPSWRLEASSGDAVVRPLAASYRDYVLEAAFWLNTTAHGAIYFGCDASGNGYAACWDQSGSAYICPVTTWTTFGTPLTTVTIPAINSGGTEEDSFYLYAVHIRENRYVTIGYNDNTDDTRITHPIANYDMGDGTLGDTDLYVGVGVPENVVYADNFQIYPKRRDGIVSPWSPTFYETFAAPLPATANFSGTMPKFNDDDSVILSSGAKSAFHHSRWMQAITGGSDAMSRVDNSDGTYTWRHTITASGAGNVDFRLYIPVPFLEPERYYSFDLKLKISPDTAKEAWADFKVYRVGSGALGQVIAQTSIGSSINTGVYTEREVTIRTPPQYINTLTNRLFLLVNLGWYEAGTHVFDISQLSLRDVTTLLTDVTT